jgi:ParB-like chromosome segregation protein Spo0J
MIWEYKTIKLSELKPATYNPREISKDEFEGLKNSLKTFGFADPAVVNSNNNVIVGGHQRIKAWEALGNKDVPCMLAPLTEEQEKKLNVLLNSQAISGKYDDLKLSEILEELKLDDDYESLRLDKLDPLDLSEQDISLPDGERGLQQMTFTLSASQVDILNKALNLAKPSIDGSEDNDNSNGNALYYIAKAYYEHS